MKSSGMGTEARIVGNAASSEIKNRAASVGIEASKSASIVGTALAAMGNMSGSIQKQAQPRKKSGVYVFDEREGGILDYKQSPAGDIRHVRSLINDSGGTEYTRMTPKQEIVTSPAWRRRIFRNIVIAALLLLIAVLAVWAYFRFGQW